MEDWLGFFLNDLSIEGKVQTEFGFYSVLLAHWNNSSQVETLNNSLQVETLNNSSQVETLNNSSQVETLNNSSQVET